MNTAQTIMAGFNLDDLDAIEDQVTFKVSVIDNEDGDSVSGFIIVGKNSPEYQEAANLIRLDNIKRSSKRNKQIDTSTDEGAATLARTVARNERAMALAITTGWYGFNLEGQPMAFDKAIVAKLFDKKPQWQARVNTALEEDANFMKV